MTTNSFNSMMLDDSNDFIKHHSRHEVLGYIPVYVNRSYFSGAGAHQTIGWWTIPNYYGKGLSITPIARHDPYRDFMLIFTARINWRGFQS